MTTQTTTSVDAQWLADVLKDAAARAGVVGAQLALWDGRELIEAATGMANRETGLAVSTSTLFQIGSTTKLFAAVLTLQLAAEGRVDLDEPVISYLPDFRLADDAATRMTTLRHLHSMTSGMDNGPYIDHGRGQNTVAKYVAWIADGPQIAPPGAMFGYSNASTTVAGRVTQEARDMDVAFVGDDGSGQATHLVNAVMAARRVGQD